MCERLCCLLIKNFLSRLILELEEKLARLFFMNDSL